MPIISVKIVVCICQERMGSYYMICFLVKLNLNLVLQPMGTSQLVCAFLSRTQHLLSDGC